MKIVFFILLAFIAKADDVQLQSGDIIFQTSASMQSYAIMWASKSLYSHVGVVEVDGKNKYVVEAISKVSRTPLQKWIKRGRLSRYAVFRYPDLNLQNKNEIVVQAKKFMGRNYDIYFTSKNAEIYCSELVELAYRASGFPVGKIQKVKELDVDNVIVRKLVEKRWRKHPTCKNGIKKFDECWARILDDELITPDSVAADSKLVKVWSNY